MIINGYISYIMSRVYIVYIILYIVLNIYIVYIVYSSYIIYIYIYIDCGDAYGYILRMTRISMKDESK